MIAENRWIAASLGLSLLVHAALLSQKLPMREKSAGLTAPLAFVRISLAGSPAHEAAGPSKSSPAIPANDDQQRTTVLPAKPQPNEHHAADPFLQPRTNVRPRSESVRANKTTPPRRIEAVDSREATADAKEHTNVQERTGDLPTTAAVPSSRGAGPGYPGGETAVAARASYEHVLATWIERHKYYPLMARRRGLQGTSSLRIALRRDGSVATSRLAMTSNHDVLDEAALDMVRRSAPFPPVPDAVGGDTFEFTVPIRFKLE